VLLFPADICQLVLHWIRDISVGRRPPVSRATHLAETVRKTSFIHLLGLCCGSHVGCCLKIGLVIGHRGSDRVHDRLGLVTAGWSNGGKGNKLLFTLSLTSVDTYVETYVVGSTIVLTSVIVTISVSVIVAV